MDRFYALYPSPGAKLYGAGHSTMGLAVGRNGLAVWENENGRPEFNSSIATTISGWAKIELRCNDRVPSLYIDDKLVLNGNKSVTTMFTRLPVMPISMKALRSLMAI